MMRSITPSSMFVLILGGLALLMGCSPWATYPKIDGAAQIGNPHFEPLPSIIATAVRHAHERAAFEGDPVYNLPHGATASTYAAIQARLREGRAMQEPGEPAVHVTEVRVRGADAEVDLIIAPTDAPPHMITCRMRQRFLHNYRVTDTKRWNIAVAVPEPSYPTQPAHEAADIDAQESPDDDG